MLRGLAVRQGVLAINAVLAVVFILIVIQMVRVGFRSEISPTIFGAAASQSSAAPLRLAEVRSRGEYDAIRTHKLFGAAGSFDPEQKPEAPPPPPPDTTEETKLPLKLSGTTVLEGDSVRAAAIIEVKNTGKGPKTYYPDDEIMERVFLKEVRVAAVVLDNRNDNRFELLQIDRTLDPASLARTSLSRAATPAVATVNRPNLITLDRADITKRLHDEYSRVAATLNVKVVTDGDGNVNGITTDNIEQYPIAQELGFKNGDVLVSVNNEPVKSRDDAVNVVKKYQSASIFRIGVLRNGQMQYITYRVR